jgi:hypothetical protein
MPEYNKRLRNAVKELQRYERLERTSPKSPEEAYGQWMYSRRTSEWTDYVIDQLQGIHDVVFLDEDEREVCTCGLIAPEPRIEIQRIHGHIQAGNVTSLIIHDFEDGRGHQLYCQDCRKTWPVVRFADDDSKDAGMIDLPKTLAKHENCPGPVVNDGDGISKVRRDELWLQMVENCLCHTAGHHVFYMKHWKDRGLNRPLVYLRSLGGTAF